MAAQKSELYFVFMKFDPQYERLKAAHRENKGAYAVDLYLSKKHDELLAANLEPGSYTKISSLVIVDGFAVQINDNQASVLRTVNEVRLVEKNQELA
ncbi:hypothetical protein V2J09_020200 [Rumex salicifolius]